MTEPFTTGSKVEEIKKGRWQYQSNPWCKSEPPQWESYSLEQNYLIEKAYYDQRKEVDIGDSLVSIKHMLQKKKGNVIQQRPIRRIDWEGDIQGLDRSARYFETELPKTMNRVFGSLGDFLLFFSRRNPDILDFSSQFEEVEKLNDLDGLHHKIIPKIVCCLEELSKPFLEQLKNPTLSGPKKIVLKPYEELISLFQEETPSFEEFYGKILRAYTMNTCLYEKLNNHLRNESWIEIDNLLPYAFCLFKAFFNFNLQTDSSQNNEIIETEHHKPRSILLYRGTAFDEGALCFYKDPQTAQQHFSWNCVTSASTNVEVAKNFMLENVDLINKKYPVLFMIEIPISKDSKSEYLKWIDIRQHSAKKEEDEVVLAPGSVFEVVKASTDEDQRTKIWLKMNNKIQFLSHGGLIMQGALQSTMMTEKDAKIVCLEGEELLSTLKCLTGNKLIEQVEFCTCKFDKRSLTAMMEILSTLERTQELKFISCEYPDQEEITSGFLKQVKRCNISKVEISGSSDFDEILSIKDEENENWISLRELKVAFGGRKNDSDDDGINDKIFQRFRHFKQLLSLTLDFFCYSAVFDKTDSYLIFDELKHLTQLTSLTVSFRHCTDMANEGVQSLASVLKNLTRLTFLALDFEFCKHITDKGVHSLIYEGLSHLTQLVSLALNFSQCYEITDKGMEILVSEGLRNLIQITSLDLNFSWCEEITDEGVLCLAFQGLRNLTKLTSLTLNLGCCYQRANKGVRSLVFQGLRYLTKLTSLTLNFSDCRQITNKGVRNLAFEGLRSLTKLTSLTLNFRSCENITNKGVRSLVCQGLRYLIQLTSLTLDFTECEGIKFDGMKNLKSQVLRYLSQLKCNSQDFFNLYFFSGSNEKNSQIQQKLRLSEKKKLFLRRVLDEQKQLTSEEELSTSTFQSFKAGPQVPLSCSFESSQEWKICLKKDLVKTESSLTRRSLSLPLRVNSTLSMTNISHPFSPLKSLTLSCYHYKEITDERVSFLSQMLRELNELTYLNLDFSGCKNITDKGVRSLASKLLQHLTQLTYLNLDFYDCKNITDKGVRSLASKGLQHLTQLTSLGLEFSNCKNLTDEALQSLTSKGFKYLTKLTSLVLRFRFYSDITDKGIQSLTTQWLQHLTQLASLDLDFGSCDGITDEGMRSLVFQGLLNLTQLTSLTLEFSFCKDITDKGVHILAFQGLKQMTQLSSLSLDFLYCEKITDFMFSNLIKILHYLGFVEEV